MNYFKKLVGNKCYLSPINTEDVEINTMWVNDIEVAAYLQFLPKIISLQGEAEALKNMAKIGNTFAIIDIGRDKYIGNCGLHEIDHINRCAIIGIFIGAKEYLGQGYGEDAVRLLLDYSFNMLNLRSVMLFVHEYNKRAIACYAKCGFKEIGRRRKARIVGGKEYDVIFMDILSDEFKGSVLDPIIPGSD